MGRAVVEPRKRQRQRYVKGQVKIDTLLAFVFGIIFVSAILYFAVTVVNPTPFQISTFKTVLALAAGGVAAMIPGQFEIKHAGVVRASGALAVFAAVFFAPASIVTPVTQLKAPTQDPAPVIQRWFSVMDSGNYLEAWKETDPATAQWYNLKLENFLQVFRNTRTPLGPVESRRLTSQGDFTNPPTYPPGLYRTFAYLSKYKNSPQCIEELIIVRATDELRWRVFSYTLSFVQMPCIGNQPEQPGGVQAAPARM